VRLLHKSEPGKLNCSNSRIWIAVLAIVSLISLPNNAESLLSSDSQSDGKQNPYADAHPYIDEPLNQLVKRVPHLKDLRPAKSQEELPVILQKTGERVDDFFSHITDLTAREEISLTRLRQELPSSHPELTGEHVRDSYLILRHGGKSQTDIVEYRTDAKGDNFDQTVVKQGYIVTSGFALNCNYFSTGFQNESKFRYLGEQTLGGQNLYVVGFAQQPGKATLSIKMRVRSGPPAQMLVQGIAWIDKSNFQIVRLRTDLLAPRWDVGLNQQTTEVTLSKVQLADTTTPLWLPSSVKVFVEFTTHNGSVDEYFELSYRNEHRYMDYQRYRVATKVVVP
jgi:hypothetical protein